MSILNGSLLGPATGAILVLVLVVAGPAMDTALALLAVVGLAISIGTAVLLPVGERVLRTLAALLIFAAFVNLCVIVGNIAVRAFRP